MGFLTEITDDVRRRLERSPLDESGLMALAIGLPPTRPFDDALRTDRPPAVIAEIKRSSRSAGKIAEADPAARARAYEAAGAAAVSVLTEPIHFDGSLADLRAVHLAVGVPVLRKDFLVPPAQVIESRVEGADAVLLIAAALSATELMALVAAAADLGMGALVETHSEADLEKVLTTDASVIGVNARDLESLEVDPARAAPPLPPGPPPPGPGRGGGGGGRAGGGADARSGPSRYPPRAEGSGLNAPTALPDARGRWGSYGGRFVPEILIPALDELGGAWADLRDEPGFRGELDALLRDFVGRPSALTFAPRLSERTGCRIYLKREDLNHTGAHKINNTLGQVLLARRLGKSRIIAETGAGMHGVATATACALFGLPCVVYMGEEDTVRQAPNVARMQLLGAEVVPVTSGSRTLKDALNEALRDWAASVRDTHYVLGSVAGPHPFPALVRDLQPVIGDEAPTQLLEREGRDPDAVVACVGGGSNAIGIFEAFVPEPGVRLIGVEAGGRGDGLGAHCRSLTP